MTFDGRPDGLAGTTPTLWTDRGFRPDNWTFEQPADTAASRGVDRRGARTLPRYRGPFRPPLRRQAEFEYAVRAITLARSLIERSTAQRRTDRVCRGSRQLSQRDVGQSTGYQKWPQAATDGSRQGVPTTAAAPGPTNGAPTRSRSGRDRVRGEESVGDRKSVV